jgi:hypothetical protein
MRKAGLVAGMLILVITVNAQVLKELPPVINTIESAERAFVTVLENIMAMDKHFYAVQQIKDNDVYSPEQTPQKYSAYLDFILNNMTAGKIRPYILSIDDVFKNFDYQSISMRQQNDINYFLQTALIDRYSFHIGIGALDDHPIPDTVVLNYDESAIGELRNQIAVLEQQLSPLKARFSSLEDPGAERTRRLYEIFNERQILNNKRHRTAEEVMTTQVRLDELRRLETDIREGHATTPLAAEYSSLRRQINELEENLQRLNSRLVREQDVPRAQAESEYRRSLCENINKLKTWTDFFDNKNTIVKDFLVMLEIKPHLDSIIANEISQRQFGSYKERLDAFLSGWGL